MAKLATTHSLSSYQKLPISQNRERLKGQSTPAGINITYTHKGTRRTQTVAVTTTPCNYGGVRYWWKCEKCSRRVAVLYGAGIFVCRHCIGANYKSQLSQPIDRLFQRVAVVRARLGWEGGIAHGHGSRPRYMHHSTYNRLVSEHDQLTQKIIGAMS